MFKTTENKITKRRHGMKFTKTIVVVAAISLLAVPAMAGYSTIQKEKGKQVISQSSTDAKSGCQLLARRGNGGKRGNGPGDGAGNGGNGPKDGTGPRSKNGTCTRT